MSPLLHSRACTAQEAWFHPYNEAPAAIGPAARAFHAAAVLDRRVFIFGGHVYVKQIHKLHQFNDLWCLNTVRVIWTVSCGLQAVCILPERNQGHRV